MIKVGDPVLINPRHSLKFGRKIGFVEVILLDTLLNIGVSFDDTRQLYYFSADELLTMEELDIWNKLGSVYCRYCGKDITGQFSFLCEDCEYPIYKEE